MCIYINEEIFLNGVDIMKNRRGSSGSRSAKHTSDMECVDIYFMEEEDGGVEEVVKGEAIATFSFGLMDSSNDSVPLNNSLPSKNNDKTIDQSVNKTYPVNPRGVTPPIDGEHFTLKRGYQLRPSTLRKLNELKSKHPDVNVYLNTILDAAILHYYEYIINEGGSFS